MDGFSVNCCAHLKFSKKIILVRWGEGRGAEKKLKKIEIVYILVIKHTIFYFSVYLKYFFKNYSPFTIIGRPVCIILTIIVC